MMEYHTNKDAAVAIRIFELGFKLFSDDVDYVIRYLQFLLSINDDTSERSRSLGFPDCGSGSPLTATSPLTASRRASSVRAIGAENPYGEGEAAVGRLGAVRVHVRGPRCGAKARNTLRRGVPEW